MTFAGFVFVFIAHKKKRKRQNIIDILLCTYGSSAIMYAHRSVMVIVTKKLL